ncbi:bifunctional protein-serine/threonine kinase/phosphatase [Halioxenophilus sp. WMMB6]|uniref:bifunctional protein-serine/threonine kinase/phosphatase n=1 Tax=Halioxenophilus sp. WMMB6 TaxID=3073815 RepID=UPI00295EDA06|nr:bifunctional protein-serine/threonine kinase/phosphatase [Halioxenophilus sp. WMMB6]
MSTTTPLESTIFDSGLVQAGKLCINFGGYSSAGKKARNEDAFAAHAPQGTTRTIKGAAACIADGVSSSDNAQQASALSVTNFIEDYYATPDSWSVKNSVGRVLASLNTWLYAEANRSQRSQDAFVTTLTGLVCKSTTAHIFHVGDSRAYRLRDNQLQPLTKDHSRILAGAKAQLTRALGIDTHLEVDYQAFDLAQGDLFLLTTDGVHDFIDNATMTTILQAAETTLEERSKAMVERALAAGSDDNLTCLCVEITSLPQEDIDEAHRRLTERVIPPVLEVGMKLDGYEVQQVLYSGPRSHIYLVKHPNHQGCFVLKAPSESFAEDALYLEGFVREQWVGRKLNSDLVMKIYPQEESRFLYHLCEYVEGQTLRQWMHDNPAPALDRVRALTRTIAQALRVLQRAGMVHRDLKPENIILTRDGHAKLIDFGTVQVDGLAEVGSIIKDDTPVGSVNYIAPEYLLGGRGVSQSDLFSLAVIVYEMLTGQQPYQLEHAHRRTPTNLAQWQYRPLRELRKDIPKWVDLVLMKAANPNVHNRYQAFSEFLQDLQVPNPGMLKQIEDAPLIEKHPARVWQLIAFGLLVIVIIQAYLLSLR